MSGSEIVTLEYERLLDDYETPLAWCFVFEWDKVFLLKSQVEDIRETAKEVDIPYWLMESKELEDYTK